MRDEGDAGVEGSSRGVEGLGFMVLAAWRAGEEDLGFKGQGLQFRV